MAGFSLTEEVHATLEHTFQIFTDIPNAAEMIPEIEKIEMLTEGPVGVGTRFQETRIMFKKEATEEFEVTRFEENREIALEAMSCGSRYVVLYQFSSKGEKTEVDFRIDISPVSIFAWIMMPLSWLMMGMMKKSMRKDLDTLIAFAENQNQPAT